MPDRAQYISMERQQELICGLSKNVTSDDFQWPLKLTSDVGNLLLGHYVV